MDKEVEELIKINVLIHKEIFRVRKILERLK